jgi:hypothetical protein
VKKQTCWLFMVPTVATVGVVCQVHHSRDQWHSGPCNMLNCESNTHDRLPIWLVPDCLSLSLRLVYVFEKYFYLVVENTSMDMYPAPQTANNFSTAEECIRTPPWSDTRQLVSLFGPPEAIPVGLTPPSSSIGFEYKRSSATYPLQQPIGVPKGLYQNEHIARKAQKSPSNFFNSDQKNWGAAVYVYKSAMLNRLKTSRGSHSDFCHQNLCLKMLHPDAHVRQDSVQT